MSNKQISKSKKENVKITSSDRTEVLLEDMRDQIKLIAEGVSIVNDKVDRLDDKVDRLDNKVDRLDNKVDEVASDLTDFKTETNANFKLLLNHLSLLEDELVDIRKELEILKKKNYGEVEKKKISNFEKRVSKLEIQFEKIILNKKVEQVG